MNNDRVYRDLAMRLPYGVKVEYKGEIHDLMMLTNNGQAVIVKQFMSNQFAVPVEEIKPYLRPQASMTRAEKCELYDTQYHTTDAYGHGNDDFYHSRETVFKDIDDLKSGLAEARRCAILQTVREYRSDIIKDKIKKL